MVYAYVIMTNHVHLILKSQNNNLSDVKRFTSNNISKIIEESGLRVEKSGLMSCLNIMRNTTRELKKSNFGRMTTMLLNYQKTILLRVE